MSRRKKVEIIPYQPPPNSIIISDEQFEKMEQAIKEAKRPNPMPWVVAGLFLVLLAVVGSTLGAVAILKPTPMAYPTVFMPSNTKTPIPTKTNTPTITPDATATKLYHPSMEVIRYYFERLAMADYGAAWHTLTEKCRYELCWDAFKSDYKLYIETMRRYGLISIQEIRPESITRDSATAFVVLFFKKEMQNHNYRFFMLFDGQDWKIDSVEFLALIK